MHSKPKPSASQPNIDHLLNLRADDLDRYINTHVDELAPHLDALRTGILETYGRYESEWLLNVLDVMALVASAGKFQQDIQRSTVDSVSAKMPEQNEPLTDTAIAVDVELARVGLGLKKAHLFRVWMVLEEHARKSGRNYVLRANLPVLLQSYGVECSERNLSRWLHKGHGLFWIVTPKGIRLIGYKNVSKALSLLARATGLRDLVATNHPGQRRYMYVNVASDKLAEFEAAIYAAWLASRNNPTIARFTLKSLFNRDLSVLREWEQIAGIEIIENFAHYTTEFSGDVPLDENGELRADVHQYRIDGQTRWKAQLSNTYIVPQAIRQHPKRGQGRRVSREVLEALESDNPTGNCEQEMGTNVPKSGGLEPLGRRYFTDSTKETASDKAQRSAQRHGTAARYLALGQPKRGQQQHVFAPDGIQRATASDCQPKHGRGVYFG